MILTSEIITDELNNNFLNKFGIEKVEHEDTKVIFHMEDTFYFEVWILEFGIGYIMKHFPSSTLDQVIIATYDFDKLYSHMEVM